MNWNFHDFRDKTRKPAIYIDLRENSRNHGKQVSFNQLYTGKQLTVRETSYGNSPDAQSTIRVGRYP